MRKLPLAPQRPGGQPAGRLGYLLLALGVVLLGLAGYVGYATYPRFHLPSVAGGGLLALAAAAGVASFFSPCAFPLLLTLLARQAREAGRGRAAGTLGFAVVFSAGVVCFLGVLGVLIGLGGRELAGRVTFLSSAGIALRITVGALLVVLGLVQAEVVPGSFHGVERAVRPLRQRQALLHRRRPLAGTLLFGFSYLLIAFG
jgi:cytochrome c biogenesis protein CcdA